MRTRLLWTLIGICLLCSGCGVCGNFFRTMFAEPIVYSKHKDDHRSKSWCRAMADRAWEQCYAEAVKGHSYSHFESGFKDGYSEYLYAGGSTAPPPVPPRRYWNQRWQNAEGHQAIRNWYAGYREGVAVALSHGCRNCAVVPSSQTCVSTVCALPECFDPAAVPTPADQ